MAANLGQAFLGAGMVPTLAQELAAGNFHENRESFHDYIYSKLILGEEKVNNSALSSPNPPVFPNTNLASSYPNPLPVVSSSYSLVSNSNHIVVGSGEDVGSANPASKAFNPPSFTKAPQKSASTKKKTTQPQQDMSQSVCPGGGEDLTKLKKKSHHKKKEKTNVCDVCGRGFAEKYTLNRHMLTHTHVKPYSCSKCNMSFSRSDGLAKHMAAGHRRIDAHHCDICGGTFNSEVSFEQHRREYGNTLPFVCNLCMLAFSQCCHLNYHMKSHSLAKMNDNIASDSLEDKNNAIDVSELIPDDFSPPKKETPKTSFVGLSLSLAKAGLLFAGRKNDDHSVGVLDPNIVVKPEIEDYSTCQSITNQISRDSIRPGPSLSNFDVLNNFISVTSSSAASLGVANLQTNQSGNNLTSNSANLSPSYLPDTSAGLSSSISSETVPISESDMKKYLDIKIPNPRFLDNSVLQGAGGNEDGLFRCEICRKGFTRKYHMQRHVKLHIRGPVPKAHLLDWTRRPYACGVCKMGFTRQHHLTRHMLIHTGERPHSCHVCGKAFRRFTNLTLHVRTVHGAERPFKCHICGRGFPRLYSLQRHLKLHAKNAAELSATSSDHLYKGFQAVGTINIENSKSPSYSSFNPGSAQQSPGHSRESISSDHSSGSERFEQESRSHKNSVGNIDSHGDNSPVKYQDRYSLMQEKHQDDCHSQSDLQSHKDQTASSLSNQTEERLCQPGFTQVMSPPDSDRVQNNKSSNNDSMIRQKSLQARTSDELIPSPRPNSEPIRGETRFQTRNANDFNHQPSVQTTSGERFIQVNSVSAHSMRTVDMSVARNVSDLDIREASNYSPSHGAVSAETFILHQQRIQSPHPMMNSIHRPGSHSIINLTSGPDTYHQSQTGFIQPPASLMAQQSTNLDLSPTRTSMSPVGILDPGTFSHNHRADITPTRSSSVSDSPGYSHSHSMNSVPFSASVHGMYQQQMTDGINLLDMRPNPTASPMPVSSHNNIDY